MATIYFTNNADSGDGSAREAWATATSGDVVAPDPNSFSGDTIEIQLASAWSARSLSLTLDGGNFRIVLNGQGSQRFASGTSANIVHTYRNIDFANFYRTDASAAPAYYSGLGSLTFENCRFYGNVGPTMSSFIRTTGSVEATLSFNNCIAYNNGATGSGRIITASASSVTLNGCTFSALAPSVGTLVNNDSLLSSEVDFTAAGFVDASTYDYRLTSSSPYLIGGTLSGTDFLGHARTGSLGAYDGSWYVCGGSDSKTLEANEAVDFLELADGAAVTFEGVDRILSASRSASVGEATLEAPTGSNGYLATPTGTDTTSATFSNVIACTYGAGLTAFAASFVSDETVGFSITKTTNAAVMVERKTGATWSTVTLDATSATTVQGVTTTTTFRAFDGATFLTSQVVVSKALPFWRILDWAIVNTSGGDGETAWKVDAWAVDPEIEED